MKLWFQPGFSNGEKPSSQFWFQP